LSTKLAYEYGALWAVKTARVGTTVPTGYRFNPDDSWMHSLPAELQQQATDQVTGINQWLTENTGLDKAYATHPEFARRMAVLGRLGRGQPKVASNEPPHVPKALKPPKLESPAMSNIPVRPAMKSNGQFKSTLTPAKLSPPKLGFAGDDHFTGGDADKKKVTDFNPKSLRDGAKDEHKEHGLPLHLAREIASDHLVEKPNYYEKSHKG
jgi:hypothetical protein